MENDQARRDDAIRVNSYTTVRRRRSVPHDRFAAYWRDVHGPLCSRIPGLGWYVQHHFARQQDAHLWPATDAAPALAGYVLDGAVEIGFGSAADQQQFTEASPILFGDEQNVFDETVAYQLPSGSTTYIDRQADPAPNGPDRLDRVHVHFSIRDGADTELAAALTEQVVPALVQDEDVIKVRVHVPELRDNSEPQPPAPNVAHDVPPERQRLVILELGFRDPLGRRRCYASAAFTRAARGLDGMASHVTPFPVVGVHTFVRDGQLTTAGLRGSRVAELIDDLAAINQVSADVRALMQGSQAG
jgi:hypothetical protein